jgi:hypothetical protein
LGHFAEINSDNIVTRVIVADQDFIDSGTVGDSSNWVQTSYNTRKGVHYAPNSNTPDGGVALRKNYAGIGYTYDATRDAFYLPQPFASWVLDEDSCCWDAPVEHPRTGKGKLTDGHHYEWDEDVVNWVKVQDE